MKHLQIFVAFAITLVVGVLWHQAAGELYKQWFGDPMKSKQTFVQPQQPKYFDHLNKDVQQNQQGGGQGAAPVWLPDQYPVQRQ